MVSHHDERKGENKLNDEWSFLSTEKYFLYMHLGFFDYRFIHTSLLCSAKCFRSQQKLLHVRFALPIDIISIC